MIVFDKQRLAEFWWLARERYQIKLRRDEGLPREQWTQDPVLAHYHFCNVFRTDDRTSRAIRAWAERSGKPYMCAVIGRLINKSSTVEALLGEQPDPSRVQEWASSMGINTNAYRLNTPEGLNSRRGLQVMAQRAGPLEEYVQGAEDIPEALRRLDEAPMLGRFIGYQVVLDLIDMGWVREDFRDDWAWPGMGARRGVDLLRGEEVSGDWKIRRNRNRDEEGAALTQGYMRSLLRKSRDPVNWPWVERPWTIHEAEFMLCEYDKWRRKSSGQSSSGRVYRG